MHQFEVLTEVVFPVEGSFLKGFLLTGLKIVGLQVGRGGVGSVAEYAMGASCGRVGDGGRIVWAAGPSFQGQVE